MRTMISKAISGATTCAIWLLLSAAGSASTDPLSIGRFTVDGGGASMQSAGSYTLSGTIGQPDAAISSAGSFTLRGGFWIASPAGSSSVESDPAAPPPAGQEAITELRIFPAAPNPATRTMQVRLALPVTLDVAVQVYDPRGALIRTLVDETLPAGHRILTWDGTAHDGTRAGAGVYFLSIRAGRVRETQKVTWIR